MSVAEKDGLDQSAVPPTRVTVGSERATQTRQTMTFEVDRGENRLTVSRVLRVAEGGSGPGEPVLPARAR